MQPQCRAADLHGKPLLNCIQGPRTLSCTLLHKAFLTILAFTAFLAVPDEFGDVIPVDMGRYFIENALQRNA